MRLSKESQKETSSSEPRGLKTLLRKMRWWMGAYHRIESLSLDRKQADYPTRNRHPKHHPLSIWIPASGCAYVLADPCHPYRGCDVMLGQEKQLKEVRRVFKSNMKEGEGLEISMILCKFFTLKWDGALLKGPLFGLFSWDRKMVILSMLCILLCLPFIFFSLSKFPAFKP